jgi:hypothetical protein
MPDINLFQCNPSTLKATKTTCLPIDMLIRLRDSWNKQYPDHKIPLTITKKERLWAAIRTRMKSQYKCTTEYCSLQKLGGAHEKTQGQAYFRPRKPDNWLTKPQEWLDTISIGNVMEQYEPAFPTFEFIGPVPIDFDKKLEWNKCVVDELCNLDLNALQQAGKTSVGVVFNLDPHDKPGSHWVCAYVDIKAKKAYYYDSYGYDACPEIRRFLRRCHEQGCTEIIWNDLRHQRKKSECGTYCMYVIISLLKGRDFADICQNRVDDDTMNAIRDLLYATEAPSEKAVKEAVKFLRL